MENQFPDDLSVKMNIAIIKKMKDYMAALAVAILTVCFGPLMPIFQIGKYSSKHINLIWDTLYGMGFAMMGLMFDYHALRPPLDLIGFFVWPLVLFGLISYCTYALLRMNLSLRVKVFLFLLLAVSFTLNVTVQQSQSDYFNWLPFFQNYSDVAY